MLSLLKSAGMAVMLATFALTGIQAEAGGHHSGCCDVPECCDSGCCCDALDGCDGGCDSCDCCFRAHSCYAALRLGASFNHLQTSGINTFGSFLNVGDDDDTTFDIGGAIGTRFPTCWGAVRVECEALSRDMFNTTGTVFRPRTPSGFYDASLDDRWSVMGNVWVDHCITDRLAFYMGGGLGRSGALLTISDGSVRARDRYEEFAWQVGGGFLWNCSNRFSVDLGYRYVDFGTALFPLTTVAAGAPAGDFGAEITSHQIILGLQYNNLRDLLP